MNGFRSIALALAALLAVAGQPAAAGSYFAGLGLSEKDVSRCLAEPFELSGDFRFRRFLLGDATQTTLIPLGRRALTCELTYWSGGYDLDKKPAG